METVDAQVKQYAANEVVTLYIVLPKGVSIPDDASFTGTIAFYLMRANGPVSKGVDLQLVEGNKVSCPAKVEGVGGPIFKMEATLPGALVPGRYGLFSVNLEGSSEDEKIEATATQGSPEIADLMFDFTASPVAQHVNPEIVLVSTSLPTLE